MTLAMGGKGGNESQLENFQRKFSSSRQVLDFRFQNDINDHDFFQNLADISLLVFLDYFLNK